MRLDLRLQQLQLSFGEFALELPPRAVDTERLRIDAFGVTLQRPRSIDDSAEHRVLQYIAENRQERRRPPLPRVSPGNHPDRQQRRHQQRRANQRDASDPVMQATRVGGRYRQPHQNTDRHHLAEVVGPALGDVGQLPRLEQVRLEQDLRRHEEGDQRDHAERRQAEFSADASVEVRFDRCGHGGTIPGAILVQMLTQVDIASTNAVNLGVSPASCR